MISNRLLLLLVVIGIIYVNNKNNLENYFIYVMNFLIIFISLVIIKIMNKIK